MAFADNLGKSALNLVDQLVTPDNLRDYRHGDKLFNANDLGLMPKNSGLFHVFFEFDPVFNQIVYLFGADWPTSIRTFMPAMSDKILLGMMAKTVTLPSIEYETSTFNAYNRKVLVQKKMKYNPVTVTLHDDSNNVVHRFYRLISHMTSYDFTTGQTNTKFDYPRISDVAENIYGLRTDVDWGIRMKQRVLRSIHIYSLSKGGATEYILMNPIISRWQHGTHESASDNPLECQLTVEYEGIRHSVSAYPTPAADAQGFAVDSYYDNSTSPLEAQGGVASIFGRGGILGGAGGVVSELAKGNVVEAAAIGRRTFNTIKNSNLKNVATGELANITRDIAKGNSTQGKYIFPAILKGE